MIEGWLDGSAVPVDQRIEFLLWNLAIQCIWLPRGNVCRIDGYYGQAISKIEDTVSGLVIVEIVLLEDNQGKQELKLWEDMWKRGISGSIQLKVYALKSFTKTLLTNVYVKKGIKPHMIMTTWHEKHFSTRAQFSHVVIVHSSVACTLFMNNMRVRIKKML